MTSDTSPSALFLLLTTLPRPHRIVDLPRKDADGKPVAQVAIVPLTQEETTTAAAEAEARTRKMLGKDLPKKDDAQSGYQDVFGNISAEEVLFRACKDPADPTLKRGAFRTPHEIAKALSADEIGVMLHNYLTVKQECGPIVSEMTDAELDSMITMLGEGGSTFPLDSLSWGALRVLISTMASRLRNLQTDKFSPGSPADPQEGDAASTVSFDPS